MSDRTVVYYTANRGDPQFEERIRHALWAVIEPLGLPLISVSQQPLDFGQNICVGDVGASAQNAWRQFQIGAQAAKTRFVCPAEADMLYPRAYFEFVPQRDDTFYFAFPLWVLFAQRGYAKIYCRKHRGSEAAMVVNRELLLKRFDEILGSLPEWGTQDADGEVLQFLTDRRRVKIVPFEMDIAAVTFKTDNQLHKRTPHDVKSKTRMLPYWGVASEMVAKYVG